MKQSTILGNSTLNVNRIGLGCMGMSEFYGFFNDAESINTLHKAIDLGVNFFDTADMYASGANEKLIGKAFKDRWSEVVFAKSSAVLICITCESFSMGNCLSNNSINNDEILLAALVFTVFVSIGFNFCPVCINSIT